MANIENLLSEVKGLDYDDLVKLIKEAENIESAKLVDSFKKRDKCMWNNKVHYFCGSVDEMDDDGNWNTKAVIQEFIESERQAGDKTIKYRKVIRKPITAIEPYKEVR